MNQEIIENEIVFKNWYRKECNECGKQIMELEHEDEEKEPEIPICIWPDSNPNFMAQFCIDCFKKYLHEGKIKLT